MSKLKEMRKPAEEKDSGQLYTILSVVIVLVAIVAMYFIFFGSKVTLDLDLLEGNANFKGNPDATVRIVEFSDFQCPACGNAFLQFRLVFLEFKDKIKFTYRHFPISNIHPFAQKAAEATECAADEGKFWEMHDLLFENQDNLTPDDLKSYAQQLNLNTTEFNQCLESGKYAVKVASDQSYALSVGVNSTPTFYVNGEKVSGMTTDEWRGFLSART